MCGFKIKDVVCGFKIEDVVEVVFDHPDGNTSIYSGMTGVVRDIRPYREGDYSIGVEFDEYVNGHDLACAGGALCEYGYGWYVGHEDIKICKTPRTNTEGEYEFEFDESSFREMLE